MSVSRLVIGIVFLILAAAFFRGRRRLRGGTGARGRIGGRPAEGGRAMWFVTVLAWIYTLVGLLWLALAFA